MAEKKLLTFDENTLKQNRIKPSYMQQKAASTTEATTSQTNSRKAVQTPELDKAVGNNTPWHERVRNTLETGTAKAADALQLGMLNAEAGLFEAGGKVAEFVGAAGGRDAVNKSPFDWLYTKADEARKEADAVRQRAYDGTGKAGQFALQAIEGGSKLATDVAVAGMTGLSTMAVTAAGAFGNGAYEAEQDGATLGRAIAYGAGSAGLEVAIEKLTGGLGKIYGKGVADDFVKNLVQRTTGNEAAQQALTVFTNAIGEGGEEALTTVLEPFVKAIYDKGETARNVYGRDPETYKELGKEALYSAAVGAVIGAAGDIATGGLKRPTQSNPIADTILAMEAEKAQQANPLADTLMGEDSTSANTDPAQAPQGEQMQAEGPSSERIREYVEHAIAKSRYAPNPLIVEEKVDDLPIGKVSPELAGKIKNEYGIDISGREHVLRDNDIRHMYNSHGPHTNEAEPLWAADIRMIPTIIAEANEVYYVPRDDGRAGLVYQYQYNGTTFYLEQIVDGEDILLNKQMIKVPTGTIPNLPGLQEAIDAKKEVPTPAPGAADATQLRSAAGPQMYVQDVRGGTSDSNIPQNGPVVNEQGPDMPSGPFHPINEQGASNAQQFYGRGPTYVPKENFEGHLTSKLASTLVNSGVTNNGVAQSLMDAIGRGELSHLKFTDEAAMRYAQDTIMRKGYASALEQFKAEISSGQRGKKLMALGIELLNNASTNGDNVTAADIATYLVDAATEQAQAIQVLHVLNKATPEGRLYFAVKGLDNLLARMEAKYGDRADNIEVNQDLINSYYEAVKGGDEDAITDAWGQVISDVAQQVPPNWMDKLNAWRYLSMLGNPKTHIRNIVGNAAFMPVRMMKDIVGAGLEAMTGTKNRTKAVLNRSSANDKALLQMSWGDYTKMMDTIQSGGKHNDDYGSIENERTIFGLKPLEAARKKSSEYLDKEDTWFSQRAYAHALAGWMKANGITPQQFAEMLNDTTSGAKPTVTHDLKVGDTVRASGRDNFGKIVGVNGDGSYSVHFKNDAGHEATVNLDGSILTPTSKKNTSTTFDVKTATTSEILSEARAYAVKEAQKATYRDTNAFSEWVSKIGKVNANSSGVQKVVGTLAEGVLPFRKTPANIVVRGMEYSPIGLAYGIGEAVYGVKNGTVSAAQAIDHIASGITGTAILGLGALLAKMGVATASEDNDEKQAAFDKLRGEQAYALKVGDRSYTIDWLAPEALPFFTGIELYNWWSDSQEGGDANLQDFFDSLGALADPILETSMLSSVNDLLDSIAYARGSGFGGIGNIAKTAVMSYISQFVPTVLGQVERSFEGGRQETYTRGDSSILNASGQYDWGNLMNKNPLYDYNQVDYVDAWGRTQDYGKGNLFNQFLNPSYVSTDRSTAVDDELQRLYDAGQTAVFPQRFAQSDQVTTYDADGESTGKRYLIAEEYEQFNRTMGETRLELAEKLIQSSAYKDMGNEAKAKAISLVYEYGKAVATKEVEASYKLDGWMQKAMDSDDPARYIQMYAATKALTPPEGSDNVKKYQELGVMAKQSRNDAEADGWIKGQFTELQGKKYDLAREYGFSPERFVEFYEAQSICDNNKKKVIDYLINNKGWPADQANNIAKLCSLWGSKEETVNNWRW